MPGFCTFEFYEFVLTSQASSIVCLSHFGAKLKYSGTYGQSIFMKDEQRVWKPGPELLEIMSKDRITPLELKEVLVDCFNYAHGDPVIANHILNKQAADAGIDWNDPDKEAFEIMIPRLVLVAESFMNPKVITANKMKLRSLINKCYCD